MNRDSERERERERQTEREGMGGSESEIEKTTEWKERGMKGTEQEEGRERDNVRHMYPFHIIVCTGLLRNTIQSFLCNF